MATNEKQLEAGRTRGDDYAAPDEVIGRIRALVPVIRENQEKTERDRRVADDLFRQVLDTGMFRMLKPVRFGGYEHGMDDFAEAAIELARGCGSVGWIGSICGMYQYLLGLYPLEAQEEIWADDPDGCTSASFVPTGTAEGRVKAPFVQGLFQPFGFPHIGV